MKQLHVIGTRHYDFHWDLWTHVFQKMEFEKYSYDANSIHKYILHLLAKKYDLIWAETSGVGFSTLFGSCLPFVKKRLNDTFLITRFHRVPSMMVEERGWKALVPLFGSDIIAWVYDCSKELKDLFPKISLENYHVVHNGVDLNVYKRRLSIKRNEKLILTLSSWWPHKRLELLIQAMHRLKQYRLVVIGEFLDDGYKQFIFDLAQDLRNVKFLGGVYDPNQKAYWMNMAGIFVLPSKLEAMSTQTMEAMACETPVLITEGGGMNQFVPKEERLPKNITAKELAEKICMLSGNKDIGKKNRAIVTRYSWENVRKEVETVLEELEK